MNAKNLVIILHRSSFHENENKKSIKNPLDSKQVETMIFEEIEKITIQYDIKQQDQNLNNYKFYYVT